MTYLNNLSHQVEHPYSIVGASWGANICSLDKPRVDKEKLGHIDLYSSLIILAIKAKRKLGQVYLIHIYAEIYSLGGPKQYSF